jgi:hypothetical protein
MWKMITRPVHLVFVLVVALSTAIPDIAGAQTTRPLSSLTTLELIDQLQNVSNKEYQVQTNIIAIKGGKLPEGLAMAQDPALKPAEVMDELVNRGPLALPELCTHLDDARKTKTTFKPMMQLMYSAEYDWNPRIGTTRPSGVTSDFMTRVLDDSIKFTSEPDSSKYVIAVGDLCFELIGRIVNRQFHPIRYQPSANVIVNSPVLCPDLCKAIRKDWADVTPIEHRRRLMVDVTQPDSRTRPIGGVHALAKYYPADVSAAVRGYFLVPVFDDRVAGDFVDHSLLTLGDASARGAALKDFIAAHSPACKDGVVLYLWEYRYMPSGDGRKVAPRTALAELIGNVDNDYPPQTTSIEDGSNEIFIESLDDIHSREVDDAVFDQFHKHATPHSVEWVRDDGIAQACMKHLAGKGHDSEFIAFCRRRIGEILDEDSKREFRNILETIRLPSTAPTQS